MARVLVIDDEPDVLLLCRVNLEHAGHEVLEAEDAATGLAILSAPHVDVVVLDVMLPARDGFDVLSELSATRPELPVVVLTAKAQWEDRVKGWRAGAADYIVKPFSPVDLAEAVDRALHESGSERAERREAELRKLLGSTGD